MLTQNSEFKQELKLYRKLLLRSFINPLYIGTLFQLYIERAHLSFLGLFCHFYSILDGKSY